MSINNMSREELELMSNTDLTYELLKECKKTMSTKDIFQKICDLLGYDESDFASKIGDFYTALTIDKRFVMLDNAEWDIRDNHKIELIVDDDADESDESEDELEDNNDETENEEENDDLDSIDDVDDDLDDDNDLADLAIVSDDDPEEE